MRLARAALALLLVTAGAAQESLRERASRAERDGNYAAAAELWLELIAAEPNVPDWYVRAGDCLGRAGRFNDGLDLLEAAKPKFPDALEIPVMMARTYSLKAGSLAADGVYDQNWVFALQDAVRLAERVLELHPAHQDARLIAAQALLELDEIPRAEAHAREAAQRFPTHPGAQILLGQIAFTEFVRLRQELQKQPGGAAQADLILRAGEARERAVKALEQAATLDPARSFPLTKLGDLRAWNGELERALECYGKALAIDPQARIDHDWIRQNSKPERRLALYEAAAAGYAKQAKHEPARAALLEFYSALARFDDKQWTAAKQKFADVVVANAEFVNAHYYAMLAAYWDGDHELAETQGGKFAGRDARAFADLLRALRDDDRDQAAGILEFLGARSYRGGRLERSRDLNHVLAWVRQTPAAWNNYAFLCRETGRFEDSLRGYEFALELEPEDPQLLNDAAVILQYHLANPENLARAKEMYERAIRNAEAVLAGGAEGDRAARARQALQDAKGNLRKFAKDG